MSSTTRCWQWLGPPLRPPVHRVVSLVPSLTEAVFRLGAGSTIVGRTAYCLHPPGKLDAVPIVGGTKDSDVETILSLAPDVVLASREENVRRRVMALASRVPVWLADPEGPRDAEELWLGLGGLLGNTTSAERLAEDVRRAMAQVDGSSRHVVDCRYYIWKDPWMAAGPDTYIARLLACCGLCSKVTTGARRYPLCGDDPLAEGCLHLLSTEPYDFTLPKDLMSHAHEQHAPWAWRLHHGPMAVLVDGRRISWYPSCTAEGIRYVSQLAAAARGEGAWPRPDEPPPVV